MSLALGEIWWVGWPWELLVRLYFVSSIVTVVFIWLVAGRAGLGLDSTGLLRRPSAVCIRRRRPDAGLYLLILGLYSGSATIVGDHRI